MNFCFSEMVAAFCDKTLPLQRSSWCQGEEDWLYLWGWQPHAHGSMWEQIRQWHPLQMDQVSPDYISTCVQLSRVQYIYSCLSFTYFSNSELLTILSKFPFTKSVHNVTFSFFFFYIYILKNKDIKNSYFAGMLSIFHILHDHHISYFERHGFCWHVVQ